MAQLSLTLALSLKDAKFCLLAFKGLTLFLGGDYAVVLAVLGFWLSGNVWAGAQHGEEAEMCLPTHRIQHSVRSLSIGADNWETLKKKHIILSVIV